MAGNSRTTTASRRGSPASSAGSKRGRRLAFGELEALASALLAVLLALLHPAVAGEIARVAEPLGETAFTVGRFARRRRPDAEHRLQRTSDALANRAGLAGETAPVHRHGD